MRRKKKEAHALLSASAASRWLHCPPSARLSEGLEEKPSDFAREGTEAHAWGEYLLLKALKRKTRSPKRGMKFFSAELQECMEGWRDMVLEEAALARQAGTEPLVLVEEKVDYGQWVPEGYGTADALIVSPGRLTVADYKHGLGLAVSAVDNPQLKCYALGALAAYDSTYHIERVRLLIYQPRRHNFSSFELNKDELLAWAEQEVKPRAALAFAGEGEFACGSWCRFCRARQLCRARAEANLLLARYDFQLPPTLEDGEIELILGKADELTAWANDVKAYALDKAMRGKAWQGWKVVEGRANRRVADAVAVAKVVEAAGKDPYERKLLSVAALEKLLGKKSFEQLIAPFVERPPGKPALVPASDKREEMICKKEGGKEK